MFFIFSGERVGICSDEFVGQGGDFGVFFGLDGG